MRELNELNTLGIFLFRIEDIGSDGGAFRVKPFKDSPSFTVIASTGMNWDHVSISGRKRCPHWEEMVAIRDMFFKDDEWAWQYNPPSDDNINLHPYCLHLWRSHTDDIPKPPKILV